ncbi:MAG TPA: DUF420 domain-containing protein [Candidatus Bathyarchaeia archaeon]|nr:DUF420 domain-containing protein [Candidatus Bathyarchaeia archaeon]
MTGLLGTRASLFSDIGLILEVMTTLFFTIGYFYERRRRKHCVVMGTAVTTNTLFVISYMISRLIREQVPAPPVQFASIYRMIVIPHGILSVLVLVLAVSQVFLAYRWRQKTGDVVGLGKRKNVHRNIGLATLALWYVSFLSGVIIYGILYAL